MVTFNNFTGSLSALEIESCSNPTQFAGNPGPGFLCTTYPSGTGNLSVNACQTGTTLTFTLTGSLTNLGSVSFLMQYPNNNSSVSGPTLGLTPAACATTPSILVDFVAAALPLANTPCLNCVNGSTAGTLGLSAPIVYIPHGTSTLQLVLYYHDYSYSGSCKLTFSIAQNKVTLATVTGTISEVTPGTVGYGTGQLPTPAVSPGAALLKGSLKCGTRSIGITGPLFFQ
jgi:hypothetical protein